MTTESEQKSTSIVPQLPKLRSQIRYHTMTTIKSEKKYEKDVTSIVPQEPKQPKPSGSSYRLRLFVEKVKGICSTKIPKRPFVRQPTTHSLRTTRLQSAQAAGQRQESALQDMPKTNTSISLCPFQAMKSQSGNGEACNQDPQPQRSLPFVVERASAHDQESPVVEAEEGPVICGRKVLQCIGQGAFGKVYEAIELETNERQVLKVTKRSSGAEKEAKILGKLPKHPHVIELLTVAVSKNKMYMFLQHGGPHTLLHAQYHEVDQRFKIDLAIDLFGDVLHGILHLHNSGVCHLDIKHDNVTLGDDDTLRLTDFGTAAYIKNPLRHCCGSFPFAAPEVLDTMMNTVKYWGDLADFFSLGVLLFDLCFGVDSMTEQLGWKGWSYRVLMRDPDGRAAEMRKVLSEREAMCMQKFQRISNNSEMEQDVIQALNGMLHPAASMRCSLNEIARVLKL